MSVTEKQIFEELPEKIASCLQQVHRVIVGQEEVLSFLLAALLARGHAMVVGVPGLAKTLMVKAIASVLGLSFSRIQFTPDLMPSDIVGYDLIQEDPSSRRREIVFVRGPIFAHFLLADEINRTPPKTQSALLQAMQENQVTVGDKTLPLQLPFQVVATQNPIEHEGTYPLPEALLDRFMMSVVLPYPRSSEELKIALAAGNQQTELSLEPRMTREEILLAQQATEYLPVAKDLVERALRFCRGTRASLPEAHKLAKEHIRFGAGPRALQHWILAAKGYAMLRGHAHVEESDLRAVLVPVLRHRILLTLEAQASGGTSDQLLEAMASDLFK